MSSVLNLIVAKVFKEIDSILYQVSLWYDVLFFAGQIAVAMVGKEVAILEGGCAELTVATVALQLKRKLQVRRMSFEP